MSTTALDKDELVRLLGSEMSAIPVYVYERVRSTNTTAQQLLRADLNESFLAVFAERQDGGRARRGRSWSSPQGKGILCSMAFTYPQERQIHVEEWPLLAALCVRDAIASFSGLQATIKWPNDIQISGKKVCGILTEMALIRSDLRCMIVGVGINVNTAIGDLPEEVQNKATSLAHEAGVWFDRHGLCAKLLQSVHQTYIDTLNGLRFADRHQEWLTHCSTVGQYARVQQGQTWIEGIVTAVDASGTMHLVANDGARHAIISGEIVESYALTL